MLVLSQGSKLDSARQRLEKRDKGDEKTSYLRRERGREGERGRGRERHICILNTPMYSSNFEAIP
jgi:hypothetical protein